MDTPRSAALNAVNATMTAPPAASAMSGPVETPIEAYTSALADYEAPRLRAILQSWGAEEPWPRASALPEIIADRLSSEAPRLLAGLGPEARRALGLFALAEAVPWPAETLCVALRCLGIAPVETIGSVLALGLLATRPLDGSPSTGASPWPPDRSGLKGAELIAHPAAVSAARVLPPDGEPPVASGPVRQVREADGLELILHLAALWQVLVEAPLRQTQQGVLYKRDRDRGESDPVLTGPITDILRPMADPVALWLDLASGIGLIGSVAGTDRIEAAPAEYWAEHAVHLPQMIASRWLAPAHAATVEGQEPEDHDRDLDALRPAILLWLARLEIEDWVALEDLHSHVLARDPDGPLSRLESSPPATEKASGKARGRGKGARTSQGPPPSGREALEEMLLGPAYLLGLVRAGEEVPGGRRVVQLTELGRYALALGPPPPPRPSFPQFLYVQPNFEIIAYRQGLTPTLIGRLSRFARWSQIGAALTLRLTPESVYRGLESGLAPDQMLTFLNGHAARPLPAGVAEAVRTWAGRRERLTYYASATLIEFPDPEALETALDGWPTGDDAPAPLRVSDRLLLVENEATIPYQRFRLAGSRDYRRPPDICVQVGADGVSLELDLGRSDLFVDAELARFADPKGLIAPDDPTESPRRHYLITTASIRRAVSEGMTGPSFSAWFRRRAGTEPPPAVRLLLFARSRRAEPLKTARPLVLTTPTAEILDGLIQHPATRDHLGARLGPNDAIVLEPGVDALRDALKTLGLDIDLTMPRLS
ncbi:hypothetical protein BH23PLA1_BH23PLA1_11900 [soil metagenome]